MKGTIVITGKEETGLLVKRTVYKGYLYSAPGASGKSTNRKFKKTYHRGDRVTGDYQVFMDAHGDENIRFEILEEE